MRTRIRTVAFAMLLAAGCKHEENRPPPPVRPANPTGVAALPAAPEGPVPDPPDVALLTVRGSALRKVLTFIAPGAPAGVVLGQLAPGFTPGVGEHGIDIDPDAPFAAIMVVGRTEQRPQGSFAVAWPLRSGMQIAQDAAAHRGFREVTQGVFAPTAPDAGTADGSCWVARKAPVGWLLVCGPRDSLEAAVPYLARAGSSAPTPDTVLDVSVRPETARRLMAMQLTALEANDPSRIPPNAMPRGAPTQAQYNELHRGAENTKQLADDLSALHATVTLDDNAYHLRAEVDFAHATGPSTRAVVGSSAGRNAARDLLALLPGGVGAYFVTGFDMQALGPLLAPAATDPQLVAALGPEMGHLQESVRALTDLRGGGDRAAGFSNEEGGTTYQVVRMADAAGAVARVRTAAMAVPRTPRPSGANPSDYFAVLPTAGLPGGSLRLRLGPDPARLPPNAPPQARRFYQRSVLFVPDGDKIFVVEALDPGARFQAMRAGAHLQVNVPAGAVAVLHLTSSALGSLLGLPAAPDAQPTNDAIDGHLDAARRGDDGAHFAAAVDAPITAINQVRDVIARVQQEQQMAEQQARQQQRMPPPGGGGGARRGPGGAGGLVMPVPGSPDQLPEPNFQLRPPQ